MRVKFDDKIHCRQHDEDETTSCVSEKDNKDVSINLHDEETPANDSSQPNHRSDECQSFSSNNDKNSLYFDDQVRTVDYVLAWKQLVAYERDDRTYTTRDLEDMKRKEEIRSEKREIFEENLILEGLELERVVVDEEIHFVKIHAPVEVLRRYAEILKLRLPMKEVSRRFLEFFN